MHEIIIVAVNCGALEAPANGNVDTSQGTVFKNTAMYKCALDYNLTGCSVSECLSTGNWSCDLPFCAGEFSIQRYCFSLILHSDNAIIQLKFGPTRYCVDWTVNCALLASYVQSYSFYRMIKSS